MNGNLETWVPKTEAGKKVVSGEISSIKELFEKGYVILEPEIVDYLCPDLKTEIIVIKRVTRTTENGRKGSFFVVAAVGDGKEIVGVGTGKSVERLEAMKKAIKDAKKNVIYVQKGCGSWECACGEPHSVPYKVEGKCGSVRVVLIPAPKGTGLVVGDTAKKILSLAGVKDVWSKTFGQTSTRVNFARATYYALKNIRNMRKIND